ncbi:hypothetical protein BDV59DRAFT_197823 [Aspergillus ambiguus]|uniref:uncharacterized protein n=1 Tax=Aspergillus ambiguus TaxID=176160 RepID=UPI003CCD3A4A
MGDRGADTEERKLDPASLMPPQPTEVVLWVEKPVSGPDRPLPQHIVHILDKWHTENPGDLPKFVYQYHGSQVSKVYDRQGRELETSIFQIVRPAKYRIFIIHLPSGEGKLVSNYFKYVTAVGSFLVAWTPDGPESEPCALRSFCPTLESVHYRPDSWYRLVSEFIPRFGKPNEAKTPTTTPRQTQLQMVSPPQTNGCIGSAGRARKRRTNAIGVPAPGPQVTSEDEVSSNESSSESSCSEEQEHPQQPLAKRRRHNPRVSTPSQKGETIFQPMYYRIDVQAMTYCFPLDWCRTARELFKRTKAFIPFWRAAGRYLRRI